MAMPDDTLKWSAPLHVAPPNRRLVGDKITLPQSALADLLAAAPLVPVQHGASRRLTPAFDPFNPHSFAAERQARDAIQGHQQQLPHPLTFRLVNPRNGRAAYAGIREFSADEQTIGLSSGLREALGFDTGASDASDAATPPTSTRENTPGRDVAMSNGALLGEEMVTVHAKQLPKGTYVKLRPLESGYDPDDWKALLERHLRDNFTTLTKGELLTVPTPRRETFRFLVDRFEPDGDGICIVDTDLEVDIEPLNEEQARETLSKLKSKLKRTDTGGGSSTGGVLALDNPARGQVLPGDYVDYELKDWNRNQDIEIILEAADDYPNLDLLVSPFSARQRSKPRNDEHVFGDLGSRPAKRLKLSQTNSELEVADLLHISVHAWSDATDESHSEVELPIAFSLVAIPVLPGVDSESESNRIVADDEIVCKNCRQVVPKPTLALHEAFCYRNNVACPKCNNIFLKNSTYWKNHWHCPHDEYYGDGKVSHVKHDATFHPSTPFQCRSCEFEAFDLPVLAQHRTTTCPGKEILCQFCHLSVPQQGPDDPSFTSPEVLLSGLTPHELADGARTTDCHLCKKIVRLRDMKLHLQLHDRDRFSKPKPSLCGNAMCGRTIKTEEESRIRKDQYGLCNECFGPLYVTSYDAEGKMLRRRIERRLLQQRTGGCGKEWCYNSEYCKTGRKNVTGEDRVISARDALPMVKPIIDQLSSGDPSGLRFCVDQASQSTRQLAQQVSAEGQYELEWCAKALEEEKGDLVKAREWLKHRAPQIGELAV